MFSLESPHRGDSNEYTQYTIYNIYKKISFNYSKSAAIGFFPRDELETAMVNEPSVFEPLKFYCTKLNATVIQISKKVTLTFSNQQGPHDKNLAL